MATMDELERALRNADAAGDVDAARALAGAITELRRQSVNAEANPSERDSFLGKVDSVVRGAADTLTFGLSDEISAGLGALTGIGGDFGDYAGNLERQRATDTADSDERGGYRLGGQIAGGVGQGVGLARAGLSAAANAAGRGAGLGRVSVGAAKDGLYLGAAQGAGSGEGVDGRIQGAITGGAVGGLLGGAAPLAVAGGSATLRSAAAPVLSRLRPGEYADRALETTLRRSGMSADEAATSIAQAVEDGQGMFTLADALGNEGRRKLAAIVRTPNDARQGVVDSLIARQSDQGRRVAGAFSDASGSTMTAAEYRSTLENLRSSEAGVNYGPVSRETTPINVNGAIGQANERISPLADQFARSRGAVPTDLSVRAPIEAGEAQIRDPIREALKTARSYLASDGLTVTNVEQAFRAKTNIDAMISSASANGRGGEVAALMPVQQALDEALARTSSNYAGARDAYKAASGRIDAIDQGRQMASARTRADDNLIAFEQLPDDQSRAAARVGYFDPKIARAENQAGSMSNTARPYLSESSRRELPAFAAPGEGERLTRRLARENTMFETSNAAMGGSKTADNLADAADLAQFDPAIIAQIAGGNWKGAVLSGITRMLGEINGITPSVAEKFAKALMETNPQAARAMLERAQTSTRARDALRGSNLAGILGLMSSGTGRLSSP